MPAMRESHPDWIQRFQPDSSSRWGPTYTVVVGEPQERFRCVTDAGPVTSLFVGLVALGVHIPYGVMQIQW